MVSKTLELGRRRTRCGLPQGEILERAARPDVRHRPELGMMSIGVPQPGHGACPRTGVVRGQERAGGSGCAAPDARRTLVGRWPLQSDRADTEGSSEDAAIFDERGVHFIDPTTRRAQGGAHPGFRHCRRGLAPDRAQHAGRVYSFDAVCRGAELLAGSTRWRLWMAPPRAP